MFSDVNNVLKLYKELHPEDEIVTKEDIVVKTLETVFINSLYNDLGFLVNKGSSSKLIMLVEAQSTWNKNMTLRMLFYLSETYRHYLRNTGQNVHLTTKVTLPVPELYIVYTGQKKDVPNEISFKEDFDISNSAIDLRVKILSKVDTTIYGQYIGLCRYLTNSVCCMETVLSV